MRKWDTKFDETNARQQARSARLYSADLFMAGSAGQRIVVKDISARGCGARAEQTPPIGTKVALSLHGVGRVQGSVVWIENGRFGIRFDKPIDVKAVVPNAKTSSDFSINEMRRPSDDMKQPGFGVKSERGDT